MKILHFAYFQVEGCKTKFTFIAEGWKYKLSEPTDEHVDKPDTKMKLTMTGPGMLFILSIENTF